MRKHKIIISITVIVILICIRMLYSNFYLKPYSDAKLKLFKAIEAGDSDIVSALLNEFPKLLNARREEFPKSLLVFDVTNNTPLMEACKYDQNKIITLLVEKGADVNSMSLSSAIKYPIIEVLNNKNYEMAWYLIENGADLTVEGERDNVATAILGQLTDGVEIEQQYELIKYLVDNNISLELSPEISTRYNGRTVFGLAVFQHNTLVVEYLLQNNMFDVNERIESDGNLTGLHLMLKQELEKSQSDSTYTYYVDSYDVCKLLLDYGADKTITDIDGKTAYDYAIELGDEKLIKLLS